VLVSCGYPVDALKPRGVLVRWNADGFPFRRLPEANTTIAGRHAIETRTSGGWCATLLGTETITVMIPRNAPGNWYQMDACLRGPGLAQREAEIAAMLSSVRMRKPISAAASSHRVRPPVSFPVWRAFALGWLGATRNGT
jgi:hypothetical protein